MKLSLLILSVGCAHIFVLFIVFTCFFFLFILFTEIYMVFNTDKYVLVPFRYYMMVGLGLEFCT